MCYLIAKHADQHGCIAVRVNYGSALADMVDELNKKVSGTNIQIVGISRPTAYGEYEPYQLLNSTDEFCAAVASMV